MNIDNFLALFSKERCVADLFHPFLSIFWGKNIDEARTATWDPNTEVTHEHS